MDIKSTYTLIKKAQFKDIDLSELKISYFQSFSLTKKAHYTLNENEIITIGVKSPPIINLRHSISGSPNKGRRSLVFSYIDLDTQLPHPHPRFSSFNLELLRSESTSENIESSIGFSNFIRVVEMSVFGVSFNGEEVFVDNEYFNERDEKYRLNIDLDIDIALCLKLENGKSILLSYDFDNETYLVNFGDKVKFLEAGILKSYWMRMNNYIEWQEKVIQKQGL